METEINSDQPEKKAKKNACVYCQKLYSKIVPHLENVHTDEKDVKNIKSLPKGSKKRREFIDRLRKEGNFLYNSNRKDLIVCRVKQKGLDRNNYIVCHKCKGYYLQSFFRKHYKKCTNKKDKKKGVLVESRKFELEVNENASEIVKRELLPVLRDDEISRFIKYDYFLIEFANYLCRKYRHKHMQKMIRAKLRYLSSLFLAMKTERPDLKDFASIFDPLYCDTAIRAINNVSRLNEKTGTYGAPSTAFNLGILLQHCVRLYITQCIKNNEPSKKARAKDLLKMLQTELSVNVNKTVQENMIDAKRRKKIVLPSKQDIITLNRYLVQGRRKSFKRLKSKGFRQHTWESLAKYTLISLQLFNRRRPGEMERAKILDFESRQVIDVEKDKEIYEKLSNESKQAAACYVRFEIRGKLGRPVPVLMHKEIVQYIEILLKYREQAEVPKKNPYVFGIKGQSTYAHLSACALMREFAVSCGAKNPSTLRATALRKHIATQSVLLDLKESQVSDLANFMGHAEKIHKEHYRLPIITRDIALMSQLLEKMQTIEESDNEDEDHMEEITFKNSNINEVSGNIQNKSYERSELSEEMNFINNTETVVEFQNPENNLQGNDEVLESEVSANVQNKSYERSELPEETILMDNTNIVMEFQNSENNLQGNDEVLESEGNAEVRNIIIEEYELPEAMILLENIESTIQFQENNPQTNVLNKIDDHSELVEPRRKPNQIPKYQIETYEGDVSNGESDGEAVSDQEIRQKARWSKEDKEIILKEFKKYIIGNKYPSGNQIQAAINKHKLKRTPRKVRSQIQNLKRHFKAGKLEF